MESKGAPDWDDLITRHAAGDMHATTALVIAALPIVERAISGRVRPSDRDDATQEALCSIVNKVEGILKPAAFPGWASVVARRAAVDISRRQRRLVAVGSATIDRLGGHDAVDIDAIATRVDAPRVEEELGRLTERERDVVLYFAEHEDASYAEAAERLRCPIGSLGPTRQRALRKLREAPGIAVA